MRVFSDRRPAKVKLITISSQAQSWQEFSFLTSSVCVKINLAPSHLSAGRGEVWGGREESRVERWGRRRWADPANGPSDLHGKSNGRNRKQSVTQSRCSAAV